jgi:putative transposase
VSAGAAPLLDTAWSAATLPRYGEEFLSPAGRSPWFNTERPHQALETTCPAERYSASARPYRGLPELEYPFRDEAVTEINLSYVFAGQTVGIEQVEDHIRLASFMHYDPGYFGDETCRLAPLEPFRAKGVTHISGTNRNPCVRNGHR